MKSALLAIFVSALFWASTLYLVPESSEFSLDHVTAVLSESTRIASESINSFLSSSSAQANSYDGSIEAKTSNDARQKSLSAPSHSGQEQHHADKKGHGHRRID
jgi:hypothetical protein